MGGFTLDEAGAEKAESLWRRGGFPEALLAADEDNSVRWRRAFIDTIVEPDLPQWGARFSATACAASGSWLAGGTGPAFPVRSPGAVRERIGIDPPCGSMVDKTY